jgi:glycerophosphoryl diester phosphodiesterase
MTTFICFAHRGARGHAPENTLLAVQKAITMGAKWIEVDVYQNSGELIVIHDRKLERTTNGFGDVTQQSLSYIRSLDAGGGEKVPFLGEVLDILGVSIGINIELKDKKTVLPLNALIHQFIVEKKLSYDQLLVSSFDHELLSQLKALDPRIRLGALVEKPAETLFSLTEAISAYSIHLHRKSVNRAFVRDAHQRGLKVFVYTVNKLSEMQQLKAVGADGVFTDFPEICPQ